MARIIRRLPRNANGTLDFNPDFQRADAAIARFNSIPLARRPVHFTASSSVPDAKVSSLFSSMNSSKIQRGKPLVRDFKNWQELDRLIAAQGSISTVNGLDSTRETLSPDRTLRGDHVRYNWDIQMISARDNDAKVAGRFIFENQDTLDYWIQIHQELQGMNNHQIVAHELRNRYVACLNTFNSRFNGVAVIVDENYDVAGDIDLFYEFEEEEE